MYQSFNTISIDGIASCVPKNTVRNDAFAEMLSPKEIKMFEKTVGILERRWADADVTASDLGFQAATDLFDAGFKKEDIKCLIFISQTSDYTIPFTSNILQDRLGLPSDILCLDINAGCAGFIQGLSTAYSMANSIEGGKVLLIVAETLSKILSDRDRSTTMLFGDAASAIIISKKSGNDTKSYFNFFTDGANYDAIRIPDGGYRNRVCAQSLETSEKEGGSFRNNLNLAMDGPKVFDFTLREVAVGVSDLLNHYNLPIDEIDYFLFHQSNNFIINQIAGQLNISREKVPVNIGSFGNTSGVTLPLLISTSAESFKGKSTKILCSGYGSGLTWGNAVLEISVDTVITNLTEI